MHTCECEFLGRVESKASSAWDFRTGVVGRKFMGNTVCSKCGHPEGMGKGFRVVQILEKSRQKASPVQGHEGSAFWSGGSEMCEAGLF